VFLNDVELAAADLPPQSFGYFITSRTPGFTPIVANSQGALCVQGSVGRFVGPGQIQSSGAAGVLHLRVQVAALPTPTGPVAAQPGETWHFQLWHRDANPMVTSNFTDAVAVTFL